MYERNCCASRASTKKKSKEKVNNINGLECGCGCFFFCETYLPHMVPIICNARKAFNAIVIVSGQRTVLSSEREMSGMCMNRRDELERR